MNLSAQFKAYLLNQKQPASKATVKNYLSDVNRFISWYEAKFGIMFEPEKVSPEVIESFRSEGFNTKLASSVERSLSSLRKFFTFLKLESIISHTPFEAKSSEKLFDPWRIKDFKNYLFVLNSSPLTIKNYIIDLKQFKNWLEETIPASNRTDSNLKNLIYNIDSALISDYKYRLLENLRLSPVSVNRKLSSLRRYTSWAQDQGTVKSDQFLHVFNESKTIIPLVIPISDHPTTKTITDVPGKNYSKFPPLRLMQKSKKSALLFFDTALIAPLALLIARLDVMLWTAKGKPVFETKSIKAPLVSILTPLQKPKGPVRNVPKPYYSPTHISLASLPLHQQILHHIRYSRPEWYIKYHSYTSVSYLHFAILMLTVILFGYLIFLNNQKEPEKTAVLATLPSAPNRILSFQGRITDETGIAIDIGTNLRMAIYTNDKASGSALLWQEVVFAAPDSDGIFNVVLGQNSSIPQSLFGQNPALWLGVTVENTPELTPRQPIATVAYAVNAETLQGLEPITNSVRNSNVILALNSSGNLTIGGTSSPIFRVTGGSFTLTGRTLVMATNTGSDGNVIISPDGSGIVDIQKVIQNTSNNNDIVPGAVQIDDILVVNAISTDESAVKINQQSTGDLITAGVNEDIKFRIDNGGNIISSGNYNGLRVSSGTINSGTWNGVVIDEAYGGTGINTSASSGIPYISSGTWSVDDGALDPNRGGTGIDTSTLTGVPFVSSGAWSVDSNSLAAIHGGTGITSYSTGDILYANNTSNLTTLGIGGLGTCLSSDGANPTWTACGSIATDSVWREAFGITFLNNSTLDFLVGGQSTESAKFAILNVADPRGSQVASLSGDLVLDSQASIQTTNNQTLTIGGGNTGDIAIAGTITSGIWNGSEITDAYISDTLTSSIFRGSGSTTDAVDLGTSEVAGILADANIADNITIGSTGSVDWDALTNFPIGCTAGNAVTSIGGSLTCSTFLTSEVDGVIGNEVTDVTDSTLVRSGAGTGVSPYTLALNLTNINTWTALQNFNGGITSSGARTGQALVQLNETGDQDILTASASGVAKFAIGNNGEIKVGSGLLSAGNSQNCLISNGLGSSATWGDCVTGPVSWWFLNASEGTIHTMNSTLDLFIGGTSTSSAKFAVLGMSTDTPVASLSGSNENGLTLDANNSSIQSVRKNTLTLGGNTTGNIQFNPGGLTSPSLFLGSSGDLGIGTTDPLATLDIRGSSSSDSVATISGNTSVSALTVDNNGTGDIINIQKSGAIKFAVLNSGDVRINNLSSANCDVKADGTGLLFCGNEIGTDGVTVDVFTADDTWTKADYPGLTFTQIIVTAGGGGGGEGETAAAGDDAAGGGGGAGGTSISMLAAGSMGSTETVTVGGGGAGGGPVNNATNNGVAGDNSSFGSLVSAVGGSGGFGIYTTAAIVSRGGGPGGTTSTATGDILLGGGGGGSGESIASMSQGGQGGASYWGGGGVGGYVTGASVDDGDNGIAYGSGGGGGAATDVDNGGLGGNGGQGVVVTMNYTSSAGDLAEWYETAEDVEAGDVVSISTVNYEYDSKLGLQKSSVLKKAVRGETVVGVVSTVPFEIMGADILSDAKHPKPIALAGRVPVKVSLENGEIKAGDLLSPSKIPGFASKAIKAGLTIGTALEDSNCNETETCKVLVMINTSYSAGALTKVALENVGLSMDEIFGDINLERDISKAILVHLLQEKQNITDQAQVSEIYTDRITAGLELVTPRITTDEIAVSIIMPVDENLSIVLGDNSKLTIGSSESAEIEFDNSGNATFSGALIANQLKSSYAELGRILVETATILSANIAELSVDSLAIATENITIAGQNIRDYIASIVDERLDQRQIAISSPILETDMIKPKNGNEIAIKLPTNDESSKLVIKNASDSAVVSIDGVGNATFSGQLSSNGLDANEARLDSVTARQASVTGTLRAGRIVADTLDLSDNALRSLQGSIATSPATINNYYYNNPLEKDEIANSVATGSATLASITADYGVFMNGFTSFGDTSFYDVNVANRLFIGAQLSIADRSINVLGANLQIQPLAQGGVDFLAGKITIDTEGNLNVNGNANFAKNVDINGKLAAGIISPLPGKGLVFQFDENGETPNIEFRTGTGSAVLSFSNQGDINSSGSGTFSKLNLNIIPKAIAVSDTEIIATGSAGTAEIKPYQNELTIKNPLVTKDSLIYITPKTSLPNQSVYLLRQIANESFTVGISKVVEKAVPFNWILIN